MTTDSYNKAIEGSLGLLRLYSPYKPPMFAVTPTEEILQPELRIREALAEAQFILNQTSKAALRKRLEYLKSAMRKQRAVNMLHFVSASGFVILLANVQSTIVKWIGASISLVAGLLAFTVPKNLTSLEAEVFADTEILSALSGDVAKIQSELVLNSVKDNPELAERVYFAIAECTRLSKKYELDSLAKLYGGFYPRPEHPEQFSKAK